MTEESEWGTEAWFWERQANLVESELAKGREMARFEPWNFDPFDWLVSHSHFGSIERYWNTVERHDQSFGVPAYDGREEAQLGP